MSEFKVGDRVRYHDKFSGQRGVATVTGVDNDGWLETDAEYEMEGGGQLSLDPSEDDIEHVRDFVLAHFGASVHQARKDKPIARGCLDYFPAALLAVAELSRVGNEQHNPGEPMHHARGKSSDHADCCIRHIMDRGTVDSDGVLHSVKAAWRALALAQEELEAAGAPLARGAKVAA